ADGELPGNFLSGADAGTEGTAPEAGNGHEAQVAEVAADDGLIADLLEGVEDQDTLVDELLEDVLAEEGQRQDTEKTGGVADLPAEEAGPEVLAETAQLVGGEAQFVPDPSSLDELSSQQNLPVI